MQTVTAADIRNILGAMNCIDLGTISEELLPYDAWRAFSSAPADVFPRLNDEQQEAIAHAVVGQLCPEADGTPSPAPMSEERAFQIVKAVNERAFVTMGIHEGKVLSLQGVSLSEMLAAASAVRAHNASAPAIDGKRTIHVIPDDRLIAAVYVFEHYQDAEDDGDGYDPIIRMPTRGGVFGEPGISMLLRIGIHGEDYTRAQQELEEANA